ncbi:MAG: glycoside hydrolase family 130 protein [Cellulophaga sp.]
MSNIPWQERPANSTDTVWRFTENPVIKRDAIPTSNSIFNSAVVPFEGGFAGVFRCDDKSRRMNIHAGFSENGIDWNINHDFIKFDAHEDANIESAYKYDPRVVFVEDRYYIQWCNGYHGPTIGMGYTFDFKTFYQMENAFLPYNRNGVLFPRKINGKYVLMSRPSDTGHTAFGEIFISQSPDMRYWGDHRHVMSATPFEESAWQCMKIGGGPVPIETKDGWLLIYHGVLQSCNGYVYSMGSALLDLEEPWKVIARSRPYLLSPQTPYECMGDVPNVVFPCAALHSIEEDKIAIYYGAADTVTAMAFGHISEIIAFTKENSL